MAAAQATVQPHIDTAKATIQPHIDSAVAAAQPHLEKAKEVVQPHIENATSVVQSNVEKAKETVTNGTGPPAQRPATTASLETGPHNIDTPYPPKGNERLNIGDNAGRL